MKYPRRAQCGSTLIEVLVTIVIVTIGLLGMASLQLKSSVVNQSAYHRLQATSLAYEISDSIFINQFEAGDGDYTLALADDAPQNAAAGTAAFIDLNRWILAAANRLPEGDLIIGTPELVDGMNDVTVRQYSITICWFDKNMDSASGNCTAGSAFFEFFANSKT